jgi:hypothetical protein
LTIRAIAIANSYERANKQMLKKSAVHVNNSDLFVINKRRILAAISTHGQRAFLNAPAAF